jgi:error-prone DNA polymerase
MSSQHSPGYTELACATNFSFLRGASPADQLVLTSLLLGHCGLGIADHNTVAGVVRAWAALRDLREGGTMPPLKLRDGSGPGEVRFEAQGLTPTPVSLAEADDTALQQLVQARAQAFRLVTGARLAFSDGTPDIIAYPENRAGWGRLCRLLTLGNRRTRKGACELGLDDLLADARDLLLIAMPGRDRRGLPALLHRLGEVAPGALWLGASMPRRGDDRRKLAELGGIAEATRIPLIATNDVLYADPAQRDLQDILTCIREGRTLENAGRLLEMNAERHLKPPAEMARLFADRPQSIGETQELLARISFDLGQLRYEYPDEPVPPGARRAGLAGGTHLAACRDALSRRHA